MWKSWTCLCRFSSVYWLRGYCSEKLTASHSNWPERKWFNYLITVLHHLPSAPVELYNRWFHAIGQLVRCLPNRPRSIYQYSNMAPMLSGQNGKFFKFLLSLNSQKRLGYKENNAKFRSLSGKPRSHVRILIYRTWPIGHFGKYHNTLCLSPQIL